MKLFGTDGIRGYANKPPMTPDIILKVAMAAGSVFRNGSHRHTVVIGKDTRLSGYMIEPALTSGFIAMGMNVVLVGPLPTPAISMLVQSMRADLGVMISASHNPYYDNGIKFFGPDGYKLCNEKESQIEALVNSGVDNLAIDTQLGRATRLEGAVGRYIEFVKSTLPKNIRFDGLKVVVDSANGAAYTVAPKVLWELGAEVISIGDDPDGFNINKNYGATAPTHLSEAVIKHDADIGIALDGDADRVVICDESGTVIDGDQIMALIARSLNEQNRLKSPTVVGTVMSNLGLETYLKSLDLDFVRTAVGDRAVTQYMRAHDCNVGGEQSGHIILSDFAKTGDGLMAALQILSVIVQARRSQPTKASDICHVFEPTPQKLVSLTFNTQNPLESKGFQELIHELTAKIATEGRILIRKSGTEPLLRIMVEHQNEQERDAIMITIISYLVDHNLVDAENFKKTG